MKAVRKAYTVILFVFVLFAVLIVVFFTLYVENPQKKYFIDVNRLALEIETYGAENVDLKKYDYILGLEKFSEKKESFSSFLTGKGEACAIREINGSYYRMDYRVTGGEKQKTPLLFVSAWLLFFFCFLLLLFRWLEKQIFAPLNQWMELPFELAKGNIPPGLKEEKSRIFGRFIWGMDLLRESLEEKKRKELELLKEKKTLLLSLSHDLNTPLSLISLYVKALRENLYPEEEKRREILFTIGKKAEEIERYLKDIISASKEDFLQFDVENGEFYAADLLEKIYEYYKERLKLIKTDFSMENSLNCLVKGDFNRALEVLQNIMENAIKYGDGKTIRLETFLEDGDFVIRAVNSGNTLDKREAVHMFDSFFRGSNVKNQPGSGLGLFICRQLMHRMDGDIAAIWQDGEMTIEVYFLQI